MIIFKMKFFNFIISMKRIVLYPLDGLFIFTLLELDLIDKN